MSVSQTRPATLKDAYHDAFRVGTAVNRALVTGKDTAAERLVLQQFNTITIENDLKAALVSPRRGVYDFTNGDAYVAFGERHHMFIVGHTLVWHNQTPPWFFQDSTGKPNTRAQQVEQLRTHIQTVAGRYKGRINAWDVVNEVIDNDGSYRPTSWVNAIGNGDTLVSLAFKFAAEAAPNTELYYNDFNTWRPAKRDGIVRLVRMLKRQGIRIDGVGMQGHWGLDYPKDELIEAAIDSFAAAGVKVNITELDVDVLPLTKEGQIIGQGMSDPQFQLSEFKEFLDPYRGGLPAAVQKQLADRYADLFRIFYSRRDKIDRVTFWGVHDGQSWKNDYPIPNRIDYPLLFGRDLSPKPAFAAVLAVPGQVVPHVERLEPAIDEIIPRHARIETVATGFAWAEGPTWRKDKHALVFSDAPNNTTWQWQEGQGLSIFLRPAGYIGPNPPGRELGSNGLTTDAHGAVVMADHGNRQIARVNDTNFTKTVLVARVNGKRFNSPNDLVYRSSGDLYFTDPPFGLWKLNADSAKELPVNGVYRLTPQGQVSLLTGELGWPNGIAFSPDEKTLYVSNADSKRPIWMAYDVTPSGGIANGRVFFDASSLVAQGKTGVPDGMRVDVHGNLFAAGPGGILVISPTGKHLGTIVAGAAHSNCAFGDDGSTLYITAGDRVMRIRLSTVGATFR